jgi:Tol biopolymer transport system component
MEGEALSQRNSSHRFRRIAGILLLLACVGGAQNVNLAKSAEQQGKIAFAYSPDINKRIDIFEINADGSGLVQLTHDNDVYSRANCCPAWSPDGVYLVFISRDPWPILGMTHSGVYIMSSSTGNTRTVLRENIMCLADPAWSPDGNRVVFARDIESNTSRWLPRTKGPLCMRYQLFSVSIDGAGLRQLTQSTDHYNKRPAWSPDGSAIAYEARPLSKHTNKADIYIMMPDGSSSHALTNSGDEEENSDPTWSPDSAKIAFSSNRNGSYEIYVMNRDGSGVQQLTHGSKAGCRHPTWSPDGREIAFSTGWNEAIYVMNANGSNPHIVTKAGWYPVFGKRHTQ